MEINDALPLCSRCSERPRRVGQRYCQPCANQYKSARYWRLKATTPPRSEEVIPAPLRMERPMHRCWCCGTVSWWQHEVGVWRCFIDGLTPTGERS
jgi:hypothetical protein